MSDTQNVAPGGAETAGNGDDGVDQVQERVAQLERENAELKDQWLRSVADFKNYKRRIENERSDLIRSANAGLLLKILPVLDDLERAMQSVTPEVSSSSWYSGFQLIPQKLAAVLESEGLKPIDAVGQEFDPTHHEAVIYEEAEGQDGKVVADLQRGYKLHDRVLRPSMVKVGKS